MFIGATGCIQRALIRFFPFVSSECKRSGGGIDAGREESLLLLLLLLLLFPFHFVVLASFLAASAATEEAAKEPRSWGDDLVLRDTVAMRTGGGLSPTAGAITATTTVGISISSINIHISIRCFAIAIAAAGVTYIADTGTAGGVAVAPSVTFFDEPEKASMSTGRAASTPPFSFSISLPAVPVCISGG